MGISVVILSYNSAEVLDETIRRARQVSDDVHVVDSFSSDDSVAIAQGAGATVVQRAFQNYGEQRNWAIQNLPLAHQWQLHLDSDERLSDQLITAIKALPLGVDGEPAGYLLARRTVFLGRALRYGGFFPIWHMRLFRKGMGRCESRLYDQHFICEGRQEKLQGELLDEMPLTLSQWTARHNRWSDLEVQEYFAADTGDRLKGKWGGTSIERKRALREWYAKLPLFLRPWLFFLYRYVLRAGFLDGRPGLIYCVLQTFWYRFLIDAKCYEALQVKTTKVGENASASEQ